VPVGLNPYCPDDDTMLVETGLGLYDPVYECSECHTRYFENDIEDSGIIRKLIKSKVEKLKTHHENYKASP
jgi:hypothetical protein